MSKFICSAIIDLTLFFVVLMGVSEQTLAIVA